MTTTVWVCLFPVPGCRFDTTGLDLRVDAGGPPSCGNGVMEQGEQCDGADSGGQTCETLGYRGGNLACNPDCTYDISQCEGDAVCGDGVREAPEECDGSDLGGQTCADVTNHTEGPLVCHLNCTLDVSGCHTCGNGVKDGDEECDGPDLTGRTCAGLGYDRGELVCTAGCLYDVTGCSSFPTNWYNLDWLYRKTITVHHAGVDADLPLFPLLVDVTDDDLRDKAQSDGDDILFTWSNGITKLQHEIESYQSASGSLTAWVSVPNLTSSTDTVLYMYYGHQTCQSQQDATQVWGPNFNVVYHLAEWDDGARSDSTQNGNDGTPAGFDLDEGVAGKMNGADEYDGNDDRVRIPPAATSGMGQFTFCFWIKTTESRTHGTFWHNPTLVGMVSTGYRSGDFAIISSGGDIGMWSGICPGSDDGFLSGVFINDDIWHHICAVNNDTQITLYVDGVDSGSTCSGGRPVDTLAFWLGAHSGEASSERGDYHSGVFDEFRISRIARSVPWILASYRNQYDPSSFYSVGAEENVLP